MYKKWKKFTVVALCAAAAGSGLALTGCEEFANTDSVVTGGPDGLVGAEDDARGRTSYKVGLDAEDLSTPEALDTSLHGIPDLPADTTTLLNPSATLDSASVIPAQIVPLPEEAQEKTLLGKIASLDEESFKVKVNEGKEELVRVNADTKYTLDGNEANWEQLMAGQKVSVQVLDKDLGVIVDATTDE